MFCQTALFLKAYNGVDINVKLRGTFKTALSHFCFCCSASTVEE